MVPWNAVLPALAALLGVGVGSWFRRKDIETQGQQRLDEIRRQAELDREARWREHRIVVYEDYLAQHSQIEPMTNAWLMQGGQGPQEFLDQQYERVSRVRSRLELAGSERVRVMARTDLWEAQRRYTEELGTLIQQQRSAGREIGPALTRPAAQLAQEHLWPAIERLADVMREELAG